MFQQFKNIDSAFRHIRLFSIAFLASNILICGYSTFQTASAIRKGQEKVYVLLNSKLLDAVAIDRSDSLTVEIRDHVKMFHYYFYTLAPDDDVNKNHLNKAFYLADNCARDQYSALQEAGYYTNIITSNISQEVMDYDSLLVNINHYPYYFQYFGKLRIIRSTSITTRSLITDGYIRSSRISDNNCHGFLITNWRILENKDLSVEKH